jgi:hypothetical protein
VVFQVQNAQIRPDSAVTDSIGQARLEVTLGSRAGSAVVTATVDSSQWRESLQVLPGAPVELLIERDGTRVDRGHTLVQLGVPFALTLKARDEYGNPVGTVALSHSLQNGTRDFNTPWQLVKLLDVQSDSLATILRFMPTALGTTDLKFTVGPKTSVSVEVVRSPR